MRAELNVIVHTMISLFETLAVFKTGPLTKKIIIICEVLSNFILAEYFLSLIKRKPAFQMFDDI